MVDGGVEMRRIHWAVLPILAGVLGFASCSEKSVTSIRETIGPDVRVIYPTSTAEHPLDVSDSVHVYVLATGSTGVSRVELWAMDLSRQDPTMINTLLTVPLDSTAVPDTLRSLLPRTERSHVYKWSWQIGAIRNGTEIRIFAKAVDPAGNVTRSNAAEVRILNQNEKHPPKPKIKLVDPTSPHGVTGVPFTFDASLTTDDVYQNHLEKVQVRWDFNNDGVWENDWDKNLNALDQVTCVYSRSNDYTVVVEARNDYLPDQSRADTVVVAVSNVGGVPDPYEPLNMVFVPAGYYHVGADSASQPYSGHDERPVHETRLTIGFYIEKTEVTNRLYLRFLKKAMVAVPPRLPLVARERDSNLLRDVLVYHPNRTDPVDPDSLPVLLLDPNYSAIYYDSFADSMAVNPQKGQLDDPVVGVTWFGAKAYAESRGLRLPTEHEWEIAARGDNPTFPYPWGATITTSEANYWDGSNQRPSLKVRGSYPGAISPFGLLDVCGNAAEWVKDWYRPQYPASQQINPEGPVDGDQKVYRGGSYLNSAFGVRVTARRAADPTTTSEAIGFRTAFTDTTSTP